MPLPKVTGVIWWRMGWSHYQSLFRRARGSEPRLGFTRDYLQASGMRDTLRDMFGGDPPYEPLTYRWPTGDYTHGRIYAAADYDQNGRVDVGQFLGGVPPEPWRLGDPAANPVITLPGTTELSIPDEAREQWEAQIAPLEPFLLMAQLEGSTTELHIRAHVAAPSTELEAASLTNVPVALRELMTQKTQPHAGALSDALPPLWFDVSQLRTPWHEEGDSTGGVVGPPATGWPVSVGRSYQPADETVASSPGLPFDVDPDERDRSTNAHNSSQNRLAALLEASGRVPRSSDGEPDFDLAWDEDDDTTVVVEVKSVTAKNAERQLRLGLGQVLRYRHLLRSSDRDVRAVLALSAEPPDVRWVELCASHDVGLVWLPGISPDPRDWLAGD